MALATGKSTMCRALSFRSGHGLQGSMAATSLKYLMVPEVASTELLVTSRHNPLTCYLLLVLLQLLLISLRRILFTAYSQSIHPEFLFSIQVKCYNPSDKPHACYNSLVLNRIMSEMLAMGSLLSQLLVGCTPTFFTSLQVDCTPTFVIGLLIAHISVAYSSMVDLLYQSGQARLISERLSVASHISQLLVDCIPTFSVSL